MGDSPWWKNDPSIAAAVRASREELERASPRSEHSGPDLVVDELFTGSLWREVAAARDDRRRADLRYVQAIRAARRGGFSWGEIGRILGESRQSLHRRFGDAN